VTKSPQQWGDLVRGADAGYRGPRPRVQVWHGTADGTIDYHDFGQEIRQWTNVLGVSQAPLATDHLQPGWIRTLYGTSENDIKVEAYSVLGAGHDMPELGMEPVAIHFFGLDHR
jgi:poly(3-hydroxybutyrate) depolymerase